MKLLFDTSLLVAALVDTHASHDWAIAWLERVRSGGDAGVVSAHSLAELYSILTTLPIRPRISADAARRMIEHDIANRLDVIELSKDDYLAVIQQLSDEGMVGGVVYDALIVQAAAKANVDQIVTLNAKDFRRVYPQLAAKITAP